MLGRLISGGEVGGIGSGGNKDKVLWIIVKIGHRRDIYGEAVKYSVSMGMKPSR